MDMEWFVLRSHPNKEELLWKQVSEKGIEVYYPRIPVRPVNPRARKIIPYFPGYMFVHTNLVEKGFSVFQWMPFSVGLVTFGETPAGVSESFIQLLKLKIEKITDGYRKTFQEFRKGDPVVINSGVFSSYSALFDHSISGTERVEVLLKMLNDRQVPVELNGRLISKPVTNIQQ